MGEKYLQQIVLCKLDTHKEKNEVEPLHNIEKLTQNGSET